jgi:hypothetical protein
MKPNNWDQNRSLDWTPASYRADIQITIKGESVLIRAQVFKSFEDSWDDWAWNVIPSSGGLKTYNGNTKSCASAMAAAKKALVKIVLEKNDV